MGLWGLEDWTIASKGEGDPRIGTRSLDLKDEERGEG